MRAKMRKPRTRNSQKRALANPEMRWLAKHPEVFTLYPEQWIAIARKGLVAHGKYLADVARSAYTQSNQPLFFLVPPDKLLAL